MTLPGGPEPVEVYATTAARTAALPFPRVGQCALTLDDGAFSIYYGRFIGWRPPWNLPWGEVGYAVIKTNSAVLPAYDGQPVDQLSIAAALLPNRQYEAVFEGIVSGGLVGDEVVVSVHSDHVVTLTDFGTPATILFSQSFVVQQEPVAGDAARFSAKFTSTGTPSNTPGLFFLSASQNNIPIGSDVLVANVNGTSKLRIIDIGPAGAPLIT